MAPDHRMDMKIIRDELRHKKQVAQKRLSELILNCDPEKLLTVMMTKALLRPMDDMIGDQYGHHAAMMEKLAVMTIPHFGTNKGRMPLPYELEESYTLLRECFFSPVDAFESLYVDGENIDSVFSAMLHSAVVRGNAYPEQTETMIVEVLGIFDNWLATKCGISPSRAVKALKCLVEHSATICNQNMEEINKHGRYCRDLYEAAKRDESNDLKDMPLLSEAENADVAERLGASSLYSRIISDQIPIDLCRLPLESALSPEEAKGIKRILGVSKDTCNDDGSIKRYPIIILTDGRVIMSEYSNALDQLWNAFDEVAQKDQAFYDQKLQKKKAKWLEEKGIEILSRIFPKDSIYQTLDYPDPDKAGKATAELDIAVKWGPFLIICEAKAKKFRFDHITGTPARLRTDLKKNAEDAYSQYLRAMRYIEKNDEAVFKERNTGRELAVRKNDIVKTFPISLSLHHLGGLATKLSRVKDINLFREASYPFSICLADLDTILKADITPDVFLHYMERRILALEGETSFDGDEHDLFLAYLDSRLMPDNLNAKDVTGIFFNGYSGQFDELMMFERGYLEKAPTIALKVPDTINKLLEELRATGTDDARMISFALLNVNDRCLHDISKVVENLRTANITYGVNRRSAFTYGDCSFFIAACSLETPQHEFFEWIAYRAVVEKYVRKTSKCIAIGVRSNQNRTVHDVAAYLESDWVEDTELERLAQFQAPIMPVPGAKLPGRNEPCVCGSGKKFKKCCLHKIKRF